MAYLSISFEQRAISTFASIVRQSGLFVGAVAIPVHTPRSRLSEIVLGLVGSAAQPITLSVMNFLQNRQGPEIRGMSRHLRRYVIRIVRPTRHLIRLIVMTSSF